MTLIIDIRDTDDPHQHSATATQVDYNAWEAEYRRGDAVVSTGAIGTPPPHLPPVATLVSSLKHLRQEADYWAARGDT